MICGKTFESAREIETVFIVETDWMIFQLNIHIPSFVLIQMSVETDRRSDTTPLPLSNHSTQQLYISSYRDPNNNSYWIYSDCWMDYIFWLLNRREAQSKNSAMNTKLTRLMESELYTVLVNLKSFKYRDDLNISLSQINKVFVQRSKSN